MLSRALRRLWGTTRARLRFVSGRHDEAIGPCQRLLQDQPDDPVLLSLLGRAYLGQKNYVSAYWCLGSALRLAEGTRKLPASVHYFFGLSAYQLGLDEDCIDALERFRRQVGRFERHFSPAVSVSRSLFYLGYAHLRQGDLLGAAERFEELVQRGGIEETGVVVDLATIYCAEEIGRFRDAIRILEEALARFPQEVELFKGLSYAHSLVSENRRSLMYALKALQLCGNDRWARQQLAYLYAQRDLQNYGEALREIEVLLEDDPEDPWALEFKRHLQNHRRGRLRAGSHLRLIERSE